MALKYRINKVDFDALSEVLKVEYIEKDGEYVLDVTGVNSNDNATGELRRAKDREVENRKAAEKRAKEAEDKLAALDDNDARKSGDIEKLEKSWQTKLETVEAASKAAIEDKDAFISTTLVDGAAYALAAKISTSPNLMLPHIKARMQADLTGDTPTTRYLDVAGNPTTAEALEKEFVDNKDFACIIVANKAKGGGAPNNGLQRTGSASLPTNDGKPVSLASLSGKALAAELTSRKEAGSVVVD